MLILKGNLTLDQLRQIWGIIDKPLYGKGKGWAGPIVTIKDRGLVVNVNGFHDAEDWDVISTQRTPAAIQRVQDLKNPLPEIAHFHLLFDYVSIEADGYIEGQLCTFYVGVVGGLIADMAMRKGDITVLAPFSWAEEIRLIAYDY